MGAPAVIPRSRHGTISRKNEPVPAAARRTRTRCGSAGATTAESTAGSEAQSAPQSARSRPRRSSPSSLRLSDRVGDQPSHPAAESLRSGVPGDADRFADVGEGGRSRDLEVAGLLRDDEEFSLGWRQPEGDDVRVAGLVEDGPERQADVPLVAELPEAGERLEVRERRAERPAVRRRGEVVDDAALLDEQRVEAGPAAETDEIQLVEPPVADLDGATRGGDGRVVDECRLEGVVVAVLGPDQEPDALVVDRVGALLRQPHPRGPDERVPEDRVVDPELRDDDAAFEVHRGGVAPDE